MDGRPNQRKLCFKFLRPSVEGAGVSLNPDLLPTVPPPHLNKKCRSRQPETTQSNQRSNHNSMQIGFKWASSKPFDSTLISYILGLHLYQALLLLMNS